MPSQQQPRTIQSPPPLPDLSSLPSALAAYLNTFSLWCRHGFADKLSATTAASGILIQAYDAPVGTNPNVYLLQVRQTGTGAPAVVLTPVPIGGGKP